MLRKWCLTIKSHKTDEQSSGNFSLSIFKVIQRIGQKPRLFFMLKIKLRDIVLQFFCKVKVTQNCEGSSHWILGLLFEEIRFQSTLGTSLETEV